MRSRTYREPIRPGCLFAPPAAFSQGAKREDHMGAQDNIKVIEQLQQAFRDRDEKRYGELFTEDADIRTVFADDDHVCAVMKVSGPFAGNQYFRGSDRPFSTYECVVYGLDGGRIREQTVYMNFLDVYVQAGLVPLSSLTAQG